MIFEILITRQGIHCETIDIWAFHFQQTTAESHNLLNFILNTLHTHTYIFTKNKWTISTTTPCNKSNKWYSIWAFWFCSRSNIHQHIQTKNHTKARPKVKCEIWNKTNESTNLRSARRLKEIWNRGDDVPFTYTVHHGYITKVSILGHRRNNW